MSLKPRNVDFQETWTKLRETVSTVVSLRSVERSVWNARFSDVYALCVAHPEPLAGRLYDETRHFLEQHVSGLLERIKGDLDLDSDDYLDGLLQRYVSLWEEYSQGVAYLNALYSYLNLQHVKRQKVSEAEIIYGTAATVTAGQDSRQLEIGELGLWWWEVGVVRPLQRALTARLVGGLEAARGGPLDTRAADVIRAAVHSTVAVQSYRVRRPLSLYEEVVLTPFLARAADCHARVAARLLDEGDVSHYMEHVLDGLSREQALCARFLDASSAAAVRVCYERAAVQAHLQELHNSCDLLVRRASEDGPDAEQRRLDASRLFALVRPLGAEALRPLVDAAHRQALAHGRSLLEADHPPHEAHTHFVSCMLSLHDKYSNLFSAVFGGCQVFMGALDKACSEVVNSQQPCRAPELLARYCDAILRRRAAPEPEAESGLARAIVVFKYLDDKDVFQKYYARALAKRLIHQLTASMELEETMINRLKAACGYEFTNKLHRMFTDVTLSTELNAKFQRYLSDKPAQPQAEASPLSVLVLQAGAWPLGGAGGAGGGGGGPLLHAAGHFETFYRASFSGRRLSWLWALSAGELRWRLASKDVLIHASALQCALLLLYQNTDCVSASEAMAELGLEGEQWKRQVVPLLSAGVLLGEAESELTLNLSLAPRRARLRIAPLPSTAADGGGSTREQTVCDDDRKMYLQAALVRIMKQRKVLRHTELVSEVVSQARGSFAPSVGMIKKCIEALIDKQYIERAPGRLDTYSYLA